jgi:outer membrane lipoprotein SlyB
MKRTHLVSLGLAVALAQGCATTRAYVAAEEQSPEPAAQSRYGRVQTVREEVRRVDNEPAEDALSGAIFGAAIGVYRPAVFEGASGSATFGAFASDQRTEARRFDVTVRFDDATFQTFSYNGYSPFLPGEQVLLTAKGLVRQ